MIPLPNGAHAARHPAVRAGSAARAANRHADRSIDFF
jgi:hypothetical protein